MRSTAPRAPSNSLEDDKREGAGRALVGLQVKGLRMIMVHVIFEAWAVGNARRVWVSNQGGLVQSRERQGGRGGGGAGTEPFKLKRKA